MQQCTSWSGYHSKHQGRVISQLRKYFKQRVFLSEQCAMSKVTTSVRRAVFQPWHKLRIVLPLVYCPVDNTLFEISPEIRCSGASSHHCCYIFIITPKQQTVDKIIQ